MMSSLVPRPEGPSGGTPLELSLEFEIGRQPDGTTCGPTCLQAVYRYFGVQVPLEQVISDVPKLESGGTLGVLLACDALRRGFQSTIYSYNLQIFDPTWFSLKREQVCEKLRAQVSLKKDAKLRLATSAYLEFLERGGSLRFRDISGRLFRRYLDVGIPILTGLSATFLYQTPRETGPPDEFDDVRGDPTGHFVVLCGYDRQKRRVLVADPLYPNPLSERTKYPVSIDRLVGAILLGILTYDANLVIIEPPKK